MGKRSHDGAFEDSRIAEDAKSEGESPGTTKRVKKSSPQIVSEALSVLLQHKDSLIECLCELRSADISHSDNVTKRLANLSKKLLPSFKTISKWDESADGDHDGSCDAAGPSSNLANTKSAAPGDKKTKALDCIPPIGSLTAWKLSDIPSAYPPLPPIIDPSLEKTAFTHHGMRRDAWEQSYENLEFLGDAFIYHISSEYISQTFPYFTPGRCSQLRERLLRNSNLAQYSLQYEFDKRAVIPLEFVGEGRQGGTRAGNKEREKLFGDIFEAYVGALIRSDAAGISRTLQWLKPLWAFTIAKDIRDEYKRRQSAQPILLAAPPSALGNGGLVSAVQKSPKVLLTEQIGCKGVTIRYEDLPGKPKKDKNHHLQLFTIGVWVDAWGKTEMLGHGSALSKKDAGSKAAENALQNKKLIRFFVDKKKAYLNAMQELAADTI